MTDKKPRVTLGDSTHFSGMPDIKVQKINIDALSIEMDHELFLELVSALDKSISEKYEKALKVYDNYWKRIERTDKLIKEIRTIFYEGDVWFVKRDIKDIDDNALISLLDANVNLLGMQ